VPQFPGLLPFGRINVLLLGLPATSSRRPLGAISSGAVGQHDVCLVDLRIGAIEGKSRWLASDIPVALLERQCPMIQWIQKGASGMRCSKSSYFAAASLQGRGGGGQNKVLKSQLRKRIGVLTFARGVVSGRAFRFGLLLLQAHVAKPWR